MKLWCVNWCGHIIKMDVSVCGRQSHFMHVGHSNSICNPHLDVSLVGSSLSLRVIMLHFNFPLKVQFCTPDTNNSFLKTMITKKLIIDLDHVDEVASFPHTFENCTQRPPKFFFLTIQWFILATKKLIKLKHKSGTNCIYICVIPY